jgi:hypothetical protein
MRESLRVYAAYPDGGGAPRSELLPLRFSLLRLGGLVLPSGNRLRGPAAYIDVYTVGGSGPRHGVNIRSAGLRTAAGPRFRT